MLYSLSQRRFFFCLLAALYFISCDEKDSILDSVGPPPGDKKPVAIAGNDVVLTYPDRLIQLDGKKSYDPEGFGLSYQWKQIEGPETGLGKYVRESDWNIAPFREGRYVFELHVADKWYQYAMDTIVVDYVVPERQIQGKVIEYGTELPIEGAEFNICSEQDSYGNCRGREVKYSSDGAGKLSFKAKSYGITLLNLRNDEYWINSPYPLPSNNFAFSQPEVHRSIFFSDAFTLTLIPKVFVPVRITNSIRKDPGELKMGVTVSNGLYTDLFPLKQGIDTVITVPVYGNMLNEFTVAANWMGDGWDFGWTPTMVEFKKSFHIPKGSVDTIRVVY